MGFLTLRHTSPRICLGLEGLGRLKESGEERGKGEGWSKRSKGWKEWDSTSIYRLKNSHGTKVLAQGSGAGLYQAEPQKTEKSEHTTAELNHTQRPCQLLVQRRQHQNPQSSIFQDFGTKALAWYKGAIISRIFWHKGVVRVSLHLVQFLGT